MTFRIERLTCEQAFNTPNIDNLIIEYASTGSNPLVQNIDPQTFIPAIKNAFEHKSALKNVIFNLLIDDDGKAQGLLVYSVYVNGNCPEMIADVDSIYVTPAYRKKGGGKKILDTLFNQAKELGARGVYISAPYGTQIDRAFQRLFRPVYVNYFKEL